MKLQPSRLAIGDYMVGSGGFLLLVSLFALPWYQAPSQIRGALLLMGQGLSHTGFQTFMWVGLLGVFVGLLALAASWFQLTRDSPALPIVTTIVLAPLSLLLALALVVRVFIALPSVQLSSGSGGGLQTCAGAYIGLAAALLLMAGEWLSLRRDDVDPGDAPAEIETVPLAGSRLSDPA
jgi:hypothetical protein